MSFINVYIFFCIHEFRTQLQKKNSFIRKILRPTCQREQQQRLTNKHTLHNRFMLLLAVFYFNQMKEVL